jgi:hypothetical protein
MRQTTSLEGIAPDDELLLLEPHPAMAAPAITAAAPNTAADLVKVTDRSPFPAVLDGPDVLRADASGRAKAWRRHLR